MPRRQCSNSLALALPILVLAFVLLLLCAPSQAANVTQFCKCACAGKRASIIALGQGKTRNKACSDCTREFCVERLSKHFCGEAPPPGEDEPPEKEGCGVQFAATCFERDSYKDEAIVYTYIILTSALLITAVVRPFASQWWKRTGTFYSSMPNS